MYRRGCVEERLNRGQVVGLCRGQVVYDRLCRGHAVYDRLCVDRLCMIGYVDDGLCRGQVV